MNGIKILAVESSGKTAGAALWETDKLLACYTENTGFTHSQRLMPMIDNMLKSVNVDISEIDAFAVSAGPGSFTGLRIGAASVKAMAHALNKPIFAVSALDGLRHNVTADDTVICPLIDARRREVYACVYKGAEKLLDECNIPLNKLTEFLSALNERVIFLGDGAAEYKEIILNSLNENALFAPPPNNLQNAGSIAFLASERFLSGERPSYSEFELSYLKEHQIISSLNINEISKPKPIIG